MAKKTPKKKAYLFTYDKKQYSLTVMQKKFCDAYLRVGVKGYEAVVAGGYSVLDKEGKIKMNDACVQASKNLRKANIRAYFAKHMDHIGLNDLSVNKAHAELINSDSGSDKRGGVDMYYKLTGKYSADKIEHTVNKDLKDAIQKITNLIPD